MAKFYPYHTNSLEYPPEHRNVYKRTFQHLGVAACSSKALR